MEIPPGRTDRVDGRDPPLAAAAVGNDGPGPDAVGSSIGSWLKVRAICQLALAPLTQTMDRIPRFKKKPDALADAEDSNPYVLAKPDRATRGQVKVQDNAVLRAWRNQLGGIMKIFRQINQAADLVSVPFLMILVLGAVVKSRQIALLGATVVVLLNNGRLVSGGANLAVIPFRDGIDPKKMKNPIWRVVEPAITIALVILAFTFIPRLSGGGSAKGSITGSDPLGGRGAQGRGGQGPREGQGRRVEKLGSQAQEKLKGLGSLSGGAPTRYSARVAERPGRLRTRSA
jgi:hypothetical protein